MAKVISVGYVVNGVARLLEDCEHNLQCRHMSCEFPRCACPPVGRKLTGALRPSYEQQQMELQKKGAKR